jgi:hypothetical protein
LKIENNKKDSTIVLELYRLIEVNKLQAKTIKSQETAISQDSARIQDFIKAKIAAEATYQKTAKDKDEKIDKLINDKIKLSDTIAESNKALKKSNGLVLILGLLSAAEAFLLLK